MEVMKLSKQYAVRVLRESDAKQVYALELGNLLYFDYCPPAPSISAVLSDMHALPPGKTMDDKYFVGYFEGEQLVVIMDLILNYPEESLAWIGLFMVDEAYRRKGIGSMIMEGCLACLKDNGFTHVRLGYMKGNAESRHFWLKNGFFETGEERENDHGMVIMMERELCDD